MLLSGVQVSCDQPQPGFQLLISGISASAEQAPLSMGFPRQEYWSGLPCPSLGDLPNTGIKPVSPEICISFVKFIIKYVIIFDATVNELGFVDFIFLTFAVSKKAYN